MNRVVKLAAGVFGCFAFSWVGLVVVPYFQLAQLQPQVDEEAGEVYPIAAGGLVAAGRRVYAVNGCVSCHTQQVRPGFAGADIERNWGLRQTVARDYLYETPVFLGSTRVGPDLSNIGARYPNPEIEKLPEAERSVELREWHHLHLYNARLLVPDSIMPPFRFLYEKRKIVGQRSDDALDLPRKAAPPEGYEVVPSDDARALVAYLLSLKRNHPVKEAVLEKEPPAPPDQAPAPDAAAAQQPSGLEQPALKEGQPSGESPAAPAEPPAAPQQAPEASPQEAPSPAEKPAEQQGTEVAPEDLS